MAGFIRVSENLVVLNMPLSGKVTVFQKDIIPGEAITVSYKDLSALIDVLSGIDAQEREAHEQGETFGDI